MLAQTIQISFGLLGPLKWRVPLMLKHSEFIAGHITIIYRITLLYISGDMKVDPRFPVL